MLKLLFSLLSAFIWILEQGHAAEMIISPELVTEPGPNSPSVKMTCALPQSQVTSDIFAVLNMNIERATDDGQKFVIIASKLGDQQAILEASIQDVIDRHPDVSGGSHIGDTSAPNVLELTLTWKPGTIRCQDGRDYKCTINYFEKNPDGAYKRVSVESASTFYVQKNLTDLDLSANVNGNTINVPPGGVTNVNGLSVGDVIELKCSGNSGPSQNSSFDWFYNPPATGSIMDTLFVPGVNDTIIQSVAGNFSSDRCLYSRTSTLRYQVRESDMIRTDSLGFRCGTGTNIPNYQTQYGWSGGAILNIKTPTTSTTTTKTTVAVTNPTAATFTTVGSQAGAATQPEDRGLVCLSCKSISQPRHCHTVERCLPDQQCGIDLTLDRFGDVYYDVGCKNTDTCKTTRSGGSSCSQCCNTDLCNVKGCGEAGYPDHTGTVCFACDLLPSGRFCHKIDICEKHEACSIEEVEEFGDILVTTGCRSTQTCHELTGDPVPPLVGRRSEKEAMEDGRTFYPSCLHCCDNDVCNTKCLNSTCVDTTTTCPQLIEANNICADPSTAITCPRSCGLCAAPSVTTRHTVQPTKQNVVTTTAAPTTITTVAITTKTTPTTTTAQRRFKDCKDIHTRNSSAPSGVYEIAVDVGGKNVLFPVRCDMTSSGGGWTIFQRRFDGSVDFYRNMTDYVNGFGELNNGGEYWLGLDKIYEMTKGQQNQLMVDVTDYTDGESSETFGSFSVDQGPNYTLHLKDRLGGTALGRLTDYDGNSFSTKDVDRDTSPTTSCAVEYHAGFWFDNCTHTSNVNGLYKPGLDFECKFNAMSYMSCDGDKAIEMKFRRM